MKATNTLKLGVVTDTCHRSTPEGQPQLHREWEALTHTDRFTLTQTDSHSHSPNTRITTSNQLSVSGVSVSTQCIAVMGKVQGRRPTGPQQQ